MLWLNEIVYFHAYIHMYKGSKMTSDIIKISQRLGLTVDEFKDLLKPYNPHYSNDSVSWDPIVYFNQPDVEGVQSLLDGFNVMLKLTEV